MKRIYGWIALAPLVAVLTFLTLPLAGWTTETGTAVLEAGANAGAVTVSEAQVWVDFLKANLGDIFSILGIGVAGVFGLGLLVRAQVKLWRADAAGNALTSAVQLSGAESAVRQVMDAAPPQVKAKVWTWVSKTFKFPLK